MIKKKIGTLHDLKKNNQFSRWIDDHDILIYKLNNEERVQELAKMLSGSEVTATAISNAKELLSA